MKLTSMRRSSASKNVQRELLDTLGREAFREYHTAFSLMSLIPLLITVYVLAAKLFTIQIFEGRNGLLFLIAIIISLLGFLIGRGLLQRILSQLVEANLKLRQHEAMKSAFIANIVHDLNSPLAAVRMSLENLSDGLMGPISDGQKDTVKSCQDILGRMGKVGTDLLEVSGARTGATPLKRDVFELQGPIQEALRQRAAYFRIRNLRWQVELPAKPVLFFGDRGKFLQAFGSLIDHAGSRMPVGRPARIGMQLVPGEVRVLVSYDDGSTTEASEENGHLEAEGSSDMGAHSGLDLELAKQIVELHRGQLWVDTNAGKPVQLVVSLPALDPRQAQSAAG